MGIKYCRSELDTLRTSINSILAQTYTEFELIICERGSSEQARSLLKDYQNADSRVVLIDGSDTCSFSEQLNRCLEHAKGEWIARMDDDDYSYPDRFACQLAYLREHDDISFVGCCVKLVQDGCDEGIQRFPEKPQVHDFLFSMPYIHPALMFRKQVLEAVSGYSTLPRCERCEDYDLLLRLYENGFSGANLQDVLFAYTLPHNGFSTRSMKDRINEFKTRLARFKALKLLPGALPYAVKPLVVGMIPARLLRYLKKRNRKSG